MATRVAVDAIQRLLGRSLRPFVDAQDEDPWVGVENAWNVVYSSIIGSMDHYHKVGFVLRNPYYDEHPLYLGDISDPATLGYINSDLTAAGKGSHTWPSSYFDYDWCPCPNGDQDYPAWNGWPVLNPLLPDYPVSGVRQIPVFLRGALVRIERTGGANPLMGKVTLSYQRAFDESLWADDPSVPYGDIHVYRFASATYDGTQGKWVPTGLVSVADFQIGTAPTITIDLGPSGIPSGQPTFFMIFWREPGDYAEPRAAPTGSDVTANTTITYYDPRSMFDEDRYDLIDYANGGNHYLKNTRSTRYPMIDGSDQHYSDENPTFYQLPALIGSLDPAANPTGQTPGGGFWYIPGIWGYGYSIDMGANDPTDPSCVVQVTISFRAAAGQETELSVVQGPIVPPEFQVVDWSSFAYYPPPPDGYDAFAHVIVRQMDGSRWTGYCPSSQVEFVGFVPSFGRVAISDVDFRIGLIPSVIGVDFMVISLASAMDYGLKPILLLTPYTSDKMTGLHDETLQQLGEFDAAAIVSYWRIPFLHPSVVTTDQTVDSVLDHILTMGRGYAEMLEFDEAVRDSTADAYGVQFSTSMLRFDADTTATDAGLWIPDGEPCRLARPLEIFFSADAGCLLYGSPDRLKYDYTLRMMLLSYTRDIVQKDVFMSASRFWLTDQEAQDRFNAGLVRDPYLWPAKLDAIHEWALYGRTAYIPNAKGGEAHSLPMREFDPRDESLPTYDGMLADLQEQYADDLNSGDQTRIDRANEAIQDALSDQEYLYGGFDTVDTRTLTDSFVGMQEAVIGVTFYNNTGVATWQASSRMWGGDHPTMDLYDPLTGDPDTRYGFSVDGTWFYQSFVEADVQQERRDYMAEHPAEADIMKRQSNAAGTPNDDFAIDGTVAGSNILLATTFTADFATVNPRISTVKLKLRRVGVPAGNIVVTINATDPSTKIPLSVLQISSEFDSAGLTEDFEWITFTFTRPAVLDSTTRYAICLTPTDPSGEGVVLSSTDRIEWAYADRDLHSYGATTTSSQVISTEVDLTVPIGSTSLTIVDGSAFSTSSFYVLVDEEVMLVSSRTGNVLTLASPTTDVHANGDMIYEVTYVPSDSEIRWLYQTTSQDTYDWVAPTNPTYDGTFELDRKATEVTLVIEVPPGDWAGADIRVVEGVNDAFYIAPTGDSYDVTFQDDPMYLFGYATGLNPLAGFNVANTYDFPPMNTLRIHITNVTDGYVGWTSERLSVPNTLTIFPLATISGAVVTYIPTATDMYVTAACRKGDGTISIVKKLVPAGTAAPILLDSGAFVGVDMLFVSPDEFQDEPFCGFDASERFEVRTV